MVKNIFYGGNLDHQMNKTNLVLIPKISSPENWTQFRPISLCNFTYKLITKVIANRLKPIMAKVISPMQSSFVKGH